MSTAVQQAGDYRVDEGTQAGVSYDTPAIVVVGSGPVGMHFVNEVLRKKTGVPVVVYGNEPWRPYDRVRLSSYLAGDMDRDDLELLSPANRKAEFEFRMNCEVRWIDRAARTISDAAGNVQRYSHLVLAVGSRPYLPAIGNLHYQGVFTFRSLGEADELFARRLRSRHTVVIGGGLLGLETARAMQKHNTRITVIEHNPWLMMQQLDERGAEFLKTAVVGNGIYVELGDSVVSILGDGRVEAISLRSGREIACDTVIVATGIKPNIELARDCGLSFGKGIRIDDRLQTSDSSIYAIGECAEHNDNVYGLVKPGLEQAAVLADRLAGGDSHYTGSLESTRLKVMEQAVLSVGRSGVFEEFAGGVNEFIFASEKDGIYRKIRLSGNCLVGAIAVGEWHESSLLQDAINRRKRLMFWHIVRFKRSGNLWGDEEDMDVVSWPAGAVVCNCTGVTRGRLTSAVGSGCTSPACLTAETRAGSVCGSCKPLLAALTGEGIAVEPVRAWRSFLALSAVTAGMALLIAFIWRIPYPDSVQVPVRWDELWRNPLAKQISGFTMLALVLAGLALSLRKRIRKLEFGDFDGWRYAHVVLGVCALTALIIHTGLRLGDQLNLLLMLNFIAIVLAGAGAGLLIAREHKLAPVLARKHRKRLTWVHILLFWPLPVLLGFHVLKSYYF